MYECVWAGGLRVVCECVCGGGGSELCVSVCGGMGYGQIKCPFYFNIVLSFMKLRG